MPMNQQVSDALAYDAQVQKEARLAADFFRQYSAGREQQSSPAAIFDSINTTVTPEGSSVVPATLLSIFDTMGADEGIQREVLMGIEDGCRLYRERNGGEEPSGYVIAAGLSAGLGVLKGDNSSYHKAILDSLTNDHHEPLGVVPAVVRVSIMTRIASSLPVVGLLPNPQGVIDMPLLFGQPVADRDFLAFRAGDRLDGPKAGLQYVENRPEVKMTYDGPSSSYKVNVHVAYLDAAALTMDTSSQPAPFNGGSVVISVNGIPVADDEYRGHAVKSGLSTLTARSSAGVKLSDGTTVVHFTEGSADLTNHSITAKFDAALGVNDVVTAQFTFDFERMNAQGIPILTPPGVSLSYDETYHLRAKSSRFQIITTIDATTQARNELGFDFAATGLAILQGKYYFEQTRRLLKEGSRRARLNGRVSTFDFRMGMDVDNAYNTRTYAELMSNINFSIAAAKVRVNAVTNSVGDAYDLFVSDRGAVLIAAMVANGGLKGTGVSFGAQDVITRIGTLPDGTNVYHVPSQAGLMTEGATTSEMILVPRSADPMRSAFIGHVSVPPVITSGDYHSPFHKAVGAYSRIAAELNPIQRFSDQIAILQLINLPVL